jgi:hypothetical protein
MLPGFKSFRIYRGDTFVFQMTLESGGEPYVLDSELFSFTGQIKEKNKSTTVASFAIAVVDENQGIVRCTLSATESAKLTGGKTYDYDIQMDNDGIVSTLLKGPILVTADVSS